MDCYPGIRHKAYGTSVTSGTYVMLLLWGPFDFSGCLNLISLYEYIVYTRILIYEYIVYTRILIYEYTVYTSILIYEYIVYTGILIYEYIVYSIYTNIRISI